MTYAKLNMPGFLARLSRISVLRLTLFIIVFAVLGTYLLYLTHAATPQNIIINYAQPLSQINPLAVGIDETGYQSPNVLANDVLEQQVVKKLHTGYIRMDLIYTTSGNPTSKIACGGNGCNSGPTGDQWISAIKFAGAQPVVIVKESSASDAANMVRHFNVNPVTNQVDPTLPNYVAHWIIGNEPDLNGISVQTYTGDFNRDNDVMKAIDPSIKVGGATTAWFDQPFLQTFLQLSGTRVDFLDFHGYPQQGTSPGNTATLFGWAASTGADVKNLLAMVQSTVPSRAAQIYVEVGEWSLNWGGGAQTASNFNAVWTADTLGSIIKNGGVSMNYGTKGNVIEWADGTATDDMGHTVTMHLDDPQAPYHGYGMFTGEGLFPSFGNTLVTATTSLPNVDVFASDNSKNIVVINKDATTAQTGVFQLNGVQSGTVDVWQKNQNVLFKDPPVHLAAATIQNGAFSYALPPMSATTLIVSPSVVSSSPPPVAPGLALTASPSQVNAGSAGLLRWATTDANSCSASGAWSGVKGASGTFSTGPLQAAATYTLTCSGAGGSVTASTTIALSSSVAPVSNPPTMLNSVPTAPVVSGSVALSSLAPGTVGASYSVDGKPVNSSQLNTNKLADGMHTLTTRVIEPNGQVISKTIPLTVNDHKPLWKNVLLKYGVLRVAGAIIILSLMLVGIGLVGRQYERSRRKHGFVGAELNTRATTGELSQQIIIRPTVQERDK